MPVGSFSLIKHFADQLQKHRPKTVLDLGIGYGLFGAIVREYLDDGVQPWKTKLMGVEGFEEYRTPQWGVYDDVIIGDIKHYVNGRLTGHNNYPLPTYDFILLSDVLEHFEKEEGRNLIYDIIDRLNCGGVLLIGTPGVFCEQGAVHGNEYERHKSLWAWNEFPVGFEVIKNGKGDEDGHYMILVKYVKPK